MIQAIRWMVKYMEEMSRIICLTTIRKLKAGGVEVYFEKEGIWTLDSAGDVWYMKMIQYVVGVIGRRPQYIRASRAKCAQEALNFCSIVISGQFGAMKYRHRGVKAIDTPMAVFTGKMSEFKRPHGTRLYELFYQMRC